MGTPRARRSSPAAPLGLMTVLVWLVWGQLGGGFSTLRWAPLALALAAALAVALVLVQPPRRERLRVVALAALAAFVGWSFLSIAWADFPGDAWTGAGKTLVYALSCAVFALWPWTLRGATAILGAFSAGVAILGVASLVDATGATEPFGTFADGRLLGPVEYVNGSVGLWSAAFFPALYLAARRDLNPALRGVFLGCATLLLHLSLLGQSRGWFAAFPIAALLFVVLAPERLRLLVAGAVVALATAVVHEPLFGVFTTWRAEGRVVEPFDGAARAVVLAAVAVALVGAAWALADRRWAPGRTFTRRASLAALAAAVVVVAAGAAVAARAVDDPSRWAADRWSEFTSGDYPTDEEGTRFTGAAGTNRYAYWVVAWDEFAEHPLTGIGADNFAASYLLARPNADYEPTSPHSTPLRLLSQLGMVGTALFVLAAALLARLALARRAGLDPAAGGAVAASLAVFGYWLLHGSVDWFWEIPALAAPAFGFLGLASAIDAEGDPAARARLASPVGAAAAVVFATSLGALLPLWLAEAYEDAARSRWRADPPAAYAALDRAAALNPLTGDPRLLEAHAALSLGHVERARGAIADAREREPENWYVYLQLALLETAAGDFPAAERAIERALALNPEDPVLAYVRERVERRHAVDPEEVAQRYLEIYDRRVGRT